MKTFSPTPKDITHNWFVVDASNKILGRLASAVAVRLRGKHKVEFCQHLDTGDFIVVVNAAKVLTTGRKLDQKIYYRRSGWIGGLKETSLRDMRGLSNPYSPVPFSHRLVPFLALALGCLLLVATAARAQSDPMPSWNEGPAKQAILAFVRTTTDPSNPNFVPPQARIATFDQDGTTWVEQPMYPNVLYCLERVRALAKDKPALKNAEPFKTVLADGPQAVLNLSMQDIDQIFAATLTGMTVDAFVREVKTWLETAKDPRYKRPYTELVYQPMLEVMRYLRANGYKTYFVTGGGQDFVRVFSEQVYGIPPEQVVGTMSAVKFGYDASGRPVLTKEPKYLLQDDNVGKPEGIHLLIGRRPYAAFGNSIGDRQMLEYTQAGDGARLMPPLKILLAEDNRVSSLYASSVLQSWGHSVEVVADGQQAIEKLRVGKFDLVLMYPPIPL